MMTMDRFMDVSYTLLVEEHQRIDPFKDLAALREILLPEDVEEEQGPASGEVERQNEQSLAQLQMMMKGVRK